MHYHRSVRPRQGKKVHQTQTASVFRRKLLGVISEITLVVVAVVVVVVVVVALTRILKPVVTGQAPAILEWKNTPE